METEILHRIQFGLNLTFHYIYPPLSIGLSLALIFFEGFYLITKKKIWENITLFWIRVFALTFALGVASGIPLVFSFGTNWARYSAFIGDVLGSALAAEGLFAFTMEAGALGILLFGWNRVSKKTHFMALLLVSFGAHFSGLWITCVNSWMQTPAGFKIVGSGTEARAVVTDFWAMMFNPSSVDRLTHVIFGCWLAGIFLVISISAYYYLKKRHMEFARVTIRIALMLAGVVLILQLISADSTARGVAKNQPSKLAAIEGIYKTQDYTAMNLIGWVNKKDKTVKGIKVPGLLSFLVFRNFAKPVEGLDKIPADEQPPVQIVFQTYHMMIYMWSLMVLGTMVGLYMMRKKKLENAKWTLRFLVISVAFPQVANLVGWMTAEIGRQPWVVWKLLRTQHGISPGIVASQVLASLIMLATIYCFLLATFLFLLDRKIKHGPQDHEIDPGAVYQSPYGGKT